MRLVLVVLFLTLESVYAKPSDVISFETNELTAVEALFFADIDDGTFDRYTLWDAFLIASGITEEKAFALYSEKLSAIRRKASAALDAYKTDDAYALGKRTLFWIHSNVISRYVGDATDAYAVIDRGEYNCLSASILYALIANDLGLSVKGVMVPDHSFCVLKDARGDKDIETTVMYGFNPGTKEIEKLKNETRYVYVPRNNYSRREEVNVQQLIAALYGNRISLIQRSTGDCSRDLPAYKKGYYLDPASVLFRENIASCFNNLVIYAIDRKEYSAAGQLIAQGKRFAPDNPDYRSLTLKIIQERARDASLNNDFSGAIAITKEAFREYPGDAGMRQNVAYYYQKWGKTYADAGKYTDALAVYEKGFADTVDPMIKKNMRAMYNNLAVTEFKKGNAAAAVRIIDAALLVFPNDAEFINLRAKAKR